ncbi:MAG TPA: hypothetical protein VKP03_03025 [Patescibacteria group bacterium]|nr:hypothetical protein [Patescibacteria group bacterium]
MPVFEEPKTKENSQSSPYLEDNLDEADFEPGEDLHGSFETAIEQSLEVLNREQVAVEDFDEAISWLEPVAADGLHSASYAGFAERVDNFLKELSAMRDGLEMVDQQEEDIFIEKENEELWAIKETAEELLRDLQEGI